MQRDQECLSVECLCCLWATLTDNTEWQWAMQEKICVEYKNHGLVHATFLTQFDSLFSDLLWTEIAKRMDTFSVSPALVTKFFLWTPAFSSIFSNLRANRKGTWLASCVFKSTSVGRRDVLSTPQVKYWSLISHRASWASYWSQTGMKHTSHQLAIQVASAFALRASPAFPSPSFCLRVIIKHRINQEFTLIPGILSLKCSSCLPGLWSAGLERQMRPQLADFVFLRV